MKSTAYKTFVRPLLEYACTVWDPYTDNLKKKLEQVQRRAARFVANKYHKSVSVKEILEKLEWPTLEQRRKTARLVTLKKILDKEVVFPHTKIRTPPNRNRRGHPKQLEQIRTRTDYRKHAFLPQTIRDWNALPANTVAAGTLDTFKSRVERP